MLSEECRNEFGHVDHEFSSAIRNRVRPVGVDNAVQRPLSLRSGVFVDPTWCGALSVIGIHARPSHATLRACAAHPASRRWPESYDVEIPYNCAATSREQNATGLIRRLFHNMAHPMLASQEAKPCCRTQWIHALSSRILSGNLKKAATIIEIRKCLPYNFLLVP